MTPSVRVLVVEDDASLRLLYRVNLELEGFAVREAATLAEARAEVEAEEPAIVFLDAHLQSESADGLLDELREAGIPVVVATGASDVERYRERSEGVLAKPFGPAELVAAAERYAVR